MAEEFLTTPNPKVTGISIVVPAYNEEVLLETFLEMLLSTSLNWGQTIQIIVVDDGSNDGMPQILDRLSTLHPEVSALHLRKNCGFGGALRAGMANVSQDLVMFCPVDYAFTDRDFETYLALIKYTDVVIGYRRNRRLGLPFIQRLSSTVFHLFVNTLFGLNFFDVNWIHMYRREHLDLIIGKSDGAFLLAENLIRANENGLTIVGVDVSIVPRQGGVATGVKLRTIIKCFLEMLVFFISNQKRKKRNDRK